MPDPISVSDTHSSYPVLGVTCHATLTRAVSAWPSASTGEQIRRIYTKGLNRRVGKLFDLEGESAEIRRSHVCSKRWNFPTVRGQNDGRKSRRVIVFEGSCPALRATSSAGGVRL